VSAAVPTEEQVTAVVADLARSVGDVNVRVTEVMLAIDSRFPGMSDAEFDQVRRLAAKAVEPVVLAGLRRIWA